jgi:hypothetical protein
VYREGTKVYKNRVYWWIHMLISMFILFLSAKSIDLFGFLLYTIKGWGELDAF